MLTAAKRDPAPAAVTHPAVSFDASKAAVIIHPRLDAAAAAAHTGCGRGDFPKGSASMRTGSSVIQYLRAGRAGGVGGGGGRVTRPAPASQFGNMLGRVGERQQNVRPGKNFHLIVGQNLRRDVRRSDDVSVCGGQHSEGGVTKKRINIALKDHHPALRFVVAGFIALQVSIRNSDPEAGSMTIKQVLTDSSLL